MPVVGPGYASGWTWICEWLDLILLVRGRGEMSKMIENQQINLQSVCTSIEDSPSMQSRIDSRNVRPYFIRMHQSMEREVFLYLSILIDDNYIDIDMLRQLEAQSHLLFS